MTANDTTYFISNPKQWNNQAEPNRHHNTFLFLRHTLYQTHGTYTIAEITNRLENSVPAIGPHGTREAGTTVKVGSSKSKDILPCAKFVEQV